MTEAQISKEIREHLTAWGFAVHSCEQGYRSTPGGTRMSPGIPDLFVMGHGFYFWVEVKRAKPRGKLRPDQEEFRDQCHTNAMPWVMAYDIRDVFQWLCDLGHIIDETP